MSTIKRAVYYMIWLFRGVKVFALVGKAGTGKSFRAQLVAQKYGIEMIIDDGLLIRDRKILAGQTAKKEKGILAAIRTALFTDPKHSRQVRHALQEQKFSRILVIGTSKGMVRKITETLRLPPPAKIINIEEVATQEEIESATRSRNHEGKHIIPVPAVEVKLNYPQIFLDSIRIFFKQRFQSVKKGSMIEKTVVRPAYSNHGRVTISETALTQMVLHCVQEFDSILNVEKVVVTRDSSDYRLEVILGIPFGYQLSGIIYQLQEYIFRSIERFAGLSLKEVNITIGRIKNG
jgi:uncharacterized alkaline shock family protein YloU/adenylate kinase family enzyme